MGYSLRTRSTAKTEPIAQPKQIKKPAAKKASVKKVTTKVKTVAIKKADVKSKAKPEIKAKPTALKKAEAVVQKKAAPKTKKAPAAPKKATKSTDIKPTKLPSKSSRSSKAIVTKTKAKAKSSVTTKKMETPTVIIEEIISVPSFLPEFEKEGEQEELLEKSVNTHIRFTDDGDDDDLETSKSEKKTFIESDNYNFEIDENSNDPVPFELSKASDYEEEEEFDELGTKINTDEIAKNTSEKHFNSELDAFTSQEEPKTFNWAKNGSNYYRSSSAAADLNKSKDLNINTVDTNDLSKATDATAPTVISNPFGFGFTAIINAANNSTSTTKPTNDFGFNASSHFQSISSPLDKLCNLTSQSNPPITIGNRNETAAYNYSFGDSSTMATSSYLPTSPVPGFGKISKSPSDRGDDREIRSPSTIQSIIVDDKHEDFSAF